MYNTFTAPSKETSPASKAGVRPNTPLPRRSLADHKPSSRRASNLGWILLILLGLVLTGLMAQAQVRYVKPIATGAGTGSSWADASGDLQAMITASASGNQVWVAAGTYKPGGSPGGSANTDRTVSFSVVPGVAVYGGFPATGNPTFAQRNPATNPTILSGDINTVGDITDNSYHVVVFLPGMGTAILDGATIREGNANGAGATANNIDDYAGGAIIFSNNGPNSPRLTDVIFTQNQGIGTGGLYTGAYEDGAGNGGTVSPVLTNCVFSSNTSASSGGGAYFDADAAALPVCHIRLSGCTFQNNIALGVNDGRGGAITYSVSTTNVANATLGIANCVFEDNVADDAGAIFADYGSYTITNSQFRRNIATGSNSSYSDGGGAIMHNDNVIGKINGCLFESNGTPNFWGGGVFYDGEPAYGCDLTSCTFVSNSAGYWGGGLYVDDDGLTVTNCVFQTNTAITNEGGGAYVYYGAPLLNCTFIGNTAGQNGGGIYIGDSNVLVSNCLFTGNTAQNGGGIYNDYSPTTVLNTTIRGNTATSEGGGVYNNGEIVALKNCILWGNTAASGAANTQQLFTYTGGTSTQLNSLV
jgi:parallel beta-helix repeat protein